MSSGQQKQVTGFAAGPSVEHERRLALKRLLAEVNDALALLDEMLIAREWDAGSTYDKLDAADKHIRAVFGLME